MIRNAVRSASMVRWIRAALVGVGGASLVGCASVPVVGSVRSEDESLFRALVVIDCDGAQAFAAETDGAGWFTSEVGRPLPLRCSVTVTKPGYAPHAYAMSDVCAVETDGACASIRVSANLAPLLAPEVSRVLGVEPTDRQTIAGLP